MGAEGRMMPDSATIKEISRKRVFAFFWVFVLVAIGETAAGESDTFLHAVDDYTDIILAVVAIVFLVLWWKRGSFKDVRKTNNLMAVLAVVLILATVFAITQEMGDPEDFGNEIPTLLFGIFMLINRFV